MSDPTDNVTPFPGVGAAIATPPATADELEGVFETKPGEPEYYYDETTSKFWLKNDTGDWVDLSESGLRRILLKRGKRDVKDAKSGEVMSEIQALLSDIERNRRVAFGGTLAGHREGCRMIAGNRILICKSPDLITPKKGDWPTLRAFFDGLFLGQESMDADGKTFQVIDQRDRFFAYMQHTLQCLYEGRISSGLALCIAGAPDCGKTRLADIIRAVTGRRVAKPYEWMIGRDTFNGDMLSATLQLIDDENADTRFASRQNLGSQVKKIVANSEVRVRAMHRDGVALELLWRLVILTNIEAHRLLVLPPVDNDIRDKLLMLKAYCRPRPPATATELERACWPLPLPTRNEAERQVWRETVERELQGWVWWLLKEYLPPPEVVGGRFIVRHWQHPQILSRLQQFSPVVRLMELLERSGVIWRKVTSEANEFRGAEYEPCETWEGTASELEKLLQSDASTLTKDEKKEIPASSWLGQRLEEMRDHFGQEVIEYRKSNGRRLWKIHKTTLPTD